ncbi:heavy metal translocating P-type ATPase [Thalassotalea atypica]|uniref:heavy metal translocating P-type ATPase n=1 Tax=Thalassotalea atypica TaxID=2054316 RepID=UPI002573622B|nr:heavy metal translocating P-type ATPase [Thalassotalea atypica]
MVNPCYHCGEIVPKGISLFVLIDKHNREMCCVGCQAVAQTIVDNNLTQYYKYRTEPAQKSSPLVPEQLNKHKLLDDEVLQNEFTHTENEFKETILTVDGISCAACAWLIEMKVLQLDGIAKISVNATTQRATVRWHEQQIKLSEILAQIDKIGYHALPFKASTAEELNQAKAKAFIRRLGISGILMMQVMMIAFGLYFGAFSDMSEHNLVYLRHASLILTIPIIFYGALPFYVGAINALRSRQLSMDVPVSIAILLAFSASAWATISQQGEVYFESVSMFTFLLLIGKFLEFRARSRAAQVSANLLKLMPMTATKLVDEKEQFIAARNLVRADVVIIRPGETVPADGVIVNGKSQLNEAMLSGEQLPIEKAIGDSVFAGTINGDGNLTVEVKQPGSNTFLSQLIRLSESSQAHKPKIAKISDKIAQYFIAVILLTAIGTAIYWQQHLPSEAFWITLSVLVATCPCALSLATPTALTCATTRLNKEGIMVKSAHVLETIPTISCFAFDKTGTLTYGQFTISNVVIENPYFTKNQLLSYAAALESHSEHPIAKAFIEHRDFSINARNIEVHPSNGISGIIDNKTIKVGKASWLLDDINSPYLDSQVVILIDDQLAGVIYLLDAIRDDAKTLLNSLTQQNIETMMLSGDNKAGCQRVFDALSLSSFNSGLSAQQKMEIIQEKHQGAIVAMVGDGVNDTPVFSAAHVAMAMGSGTDVAKSGADVILLNNRLSSISLLSKVAKLTKRVIWQNYLWAFGYNALVLPLAVSGMITPYMAVIGMSASSILVITNSLRLLKA